MVGSKIISSGAPKGTFIRGKIYGTPKPGVCMSIKAAVEPVLGQFTWEPFNPASGAKALIAVLTEDEYQGFTYDSAYVSGTQCFLYCPAPGELMNMRKASESGTADDSIIGTTLYMVETATGKLLIDSSGDSKPFQAAETLTDPTAEALVLCFATGQ